MWLFREWCSQVVGRMSYTEAMRRHQKEFADNETRITGNYHEQIGII